MYIAFDRPPPLQVDLATPNPSKVGALLRETSRFPRTWSCDRARAWPVHSHMRGYVPPTRVRTTTSIYTEGLRPLSIEYHHLSSSHTLSRNSGSKSIVRNGTRGAVRSLWGGPHTSGIMLAFPYIFLLFLALLLPPFPPSMATL